MTDWLGGMEATWPAAACQTIGPWRIRNGLGGGNRVSAATAEAQWDDADIAAAEAAQARLGQPSLFMLRDGEERLDAALAARGYALAAPVVLYAAPVPALAAVPPRRMTTFPVWPMLAIMRDLWAEGGIGPARIAVMERAPGPKAAIMGRIEDRAAGCLFAACDGGLAFVHALWVSPAFRRKGLAGELMRAAAVWAAAKGAERLALAVERDNTPGNGLYQALGMTVVARYHYRKRTGPPA